MTIEFKYFSGAADSEKLDAITRGENVEFFVGADSRRLYKIVQKVDEGVGEPFAAIKSELSHLSSIALPRNKEIYELNRMALDLTRDQIIGQ